MRRGAVLAVIVIAVALVGCGKYGCTYIPIIQHDGPHWLLRLDNGHREGWREVSHRRWEQCAVTSWCST